MDGSDLFAYFWLGTLAIVAVIGPIGAIRDLRRGSTRLLNFDDYRAERDVDPSAFWLGVLGQILVCPVAIFMFWMGLEMLEWA